jgi:dTDP-glucose 4,6-dehydratase
MKILVTGGAGFIGANFIRLAMNGRFPNIQEVVVLDKLTYAGNYEFLKEFEGQPNFTFIEGDITNSDLISKLISEVDAVVNFAAESHVDRSITDASVFMETNILGVHVILDALIKWPQKRFLQISTDEVYGSIEKGTWSELEPLLPNSPYAASKASADLLVRSYFRTFDLDVVTTRCSNNYGPRQYPEKLIPVIIKSVLLGEKIPIYGDGTNSRDWLYVEDHCDAIYLVLSRGQTGEVYNIGGGTELTNLQLAKVILEYMNQDESQINFVANRLGHDFRYAVNWEKIRQLGYTPRVDFEFGLPKTIDWYVSNKRFLGIS